MTRLTPEQRARLRAVAERATPGPWIERDGAPHDVLTEWEESERRGRLIICEHAGPDAAHIAAADPSTVLALLDDVEGLQGALEVARKDLLHIGDVYLHPSRVDDAIARIDAALAAHPSPPVGGDAGEVG